jgi:integrase
MIAVSTISCEIFIQPGSPTVNVNSLVYKHFNPILKKSDLPNIRLYDLRHTAATLALTVGVSPKVVSEQLGHTSAAFTLDVYSHVLPHMQDDAAARVEAALLGPTNVHMPSN